MAGIDCPACKDGKLRRHCPDPHPTCGWDECVRCRSTVDRMTGRHSHPPALGETCKACGPFTRVQAGRS